MNTRHRFFVSLLAALLVCVSGQAQTRQGPLPPQPRIELRAGLHLIQAELVNTADTRARGLMFRERLAPNHGMLFVFDMPATQCMWMRNTFIPLSVAFIDDRGRIVNIEDMAPLTETSHCSRLPVRYALEMEQGWFAQRGLGPGASLRGLPGATP
jgi:uncharacterized membrane protein (UPF0127 family)